MKQLQKLSKELPFIQETSKMKQRLDALKPLGVDVENRVFQKLRLDWNYNTNAIEGNSFTRGETISLLLEGITAKGKPLKDALDIKGHNEAIDFMMSILKDKRELTESDIRGLHTMVLGQDYYNPAQTKEGLPTRKLIKGGIYKTEPNHVKTATGATHYYASVEETPIKMQELVAWYNEASKAEGVHPVVLASLFHHKFVSIHPFDDGNGRMTRLLTNLILLKFGYPVSVVKEEKRKEYYAALAQADNGEIIPIIQLIDETIKDSFSIYFKAIDGEDISEINDIDKEIELFRREIGFKKTKNISRNELDLEVFFYELYKLPSKKFNKFSDIFNRFSESISFKINGQENMSVFHSHLLKSINVFKESLNSRASNVSYFEYRVTFDDDVINQNHTPIIVTIRYNFNQLNYTITTDGVESITKLYSEKVNNEKYKEFIGNVVKSLIKEIKSK